MTESGVQRRLTTILAADVVGFSAMMGAAEEQTLADLQAHLSELIHPLAAEHGGRIFKLMGDGLLMEFGSVVDAVEFSLDVQQSSAERNEDVPDGRRIVFRIGINIGDVIVDDDDLFGDGVNVAARIEGLAQPGGVAVSASTRDQVHMKMDLEFRDLGPQRVKNIAEPVRVYSVSGRTGAVPGNSTPTSGPTAAKERPSIAVLPFLNRSGDAEQDFLAEGISEDLITALSKIRWFTVINRASSFTFDPAETSVEKVARELNVRYVLDGSVRKSGQRIRVTVKLTDATTGANAWAEHYDRELVDIFELQDEMTRTLVAALEPEISAAERERALQKPTENLDAWELYQRGLWHMWTWQPEHNAAALEMLHEATEADPGFSQAYGYLTYAHYQSVILSWDPDTDARLAAGMEAADKAIEADEQEPIAHFAKGRILMMRGQQDAAVASLRRSLKLNPSFAQAYHGLGMALSLAGQHEEAQTQSASAALLSPRDPLLWAFTAVHSLTYMLDRDYQGALEQAEETHHHPRAVGYWPVGLMAGALAGVGRVDEAEEFGRLAVAAEPRFSIAFLHDLLPTKEEGGLNGWTEPLRAAGVPEEPAAGGG